jgi:hypothetical protein
MNNSAINLLTDDEVFRLLDQARNQLEIYEEIQITSDQCEQISTDIYTWNRPLTVVLNEASHAIME